MPGQKHVNDYFRELRKSELDMALDAKDFAELAQHRAVADFIQQVLLELTGTLDGLLQGYESSLQFMEEEMKE